MASKNIILKADLHLHTKEDPKEKYSILYDSFQLIDHLEQNGFDIFSITLHEGMFDDKMMDKVRNYAKGKGMIYIPGIEQNIEGKHMVILNMEKDDAEKIHRYKDLKNGLRKYAKRDVLIMAAHPYYPFNISAKDKINEWQESIDCIEYNSFYLKYINFNKKSQIEAKKLGKVMVGNTDAHIIEQIGNTYTNIILQSKDIGIHDKESFKNIVKNSSRERYDQIVNMILRNIKKGNVKINTRPLKPFYVVKTLIKFLVN